MKEELIDMIEDVIDNDDELTIRVSINDGNCFVLRFKPESLEDRGDKITISSKNELYYLILNEVTRGEDDEYIIRNKDTFIIISL